MSKCIKLNGSPEKRNGNSRAALYKKPMKCDNYKLGIDYEESPQESRRQEFLKQQKKLVNFVPAVILKIKKLLKKRYHKVGLTFLFQLIRNRETAFNSTRGILGEDYNSEDEDEIEIDVDKGNKNFAKYRPQYYENHLMLSEWMLEVPQDLIEKWEFVPCPEGRRTLLVARKV